MPTAAGFANQGSFLETHLFFRAASWVLTAAFFSGLAMAFSRFVSNRSAAPWMTKLHGYAASSGIGLLVFAWINIGVSSAGIYALATLAAAAAAGLVLSLGYRHRGKPSPEWLVFTHMCVAFMGFLIVVAMGLSQLP
jgi:hypothetical protein